MSGKAKPYSSTSADVARRAGVSPSTISAVLNGRADTVRISAETRVKVLTAAAELGYVPNHAARSLRRRGTGILTFVLPSLDNAYFADVVRAAQDAAQARGYAVAVIPTGAQPGEFHGLSVFRGAAFDGVIAAGRENCAAETLSHLAARGVAVVVLQEAGAHPAIRGVGVDLEAGGYLATRHLIGLGHRRIAHVTEALPAALTRPERVDGYRRALSEAGIAFDPGLVLTAPNTLAGGDAAIRALVDRGPARPTAAFLYNDQMAVGALHGLRARGFEVPRDFAVVGFDGLELGAYTAPPLTTVDHPREELGRRAATILIDAIEGRLACPDEPLLPVSLTVRASCGAVIQRTP